MDPIRPPDKVIRQQLYDTDNDFNDNDNDFNDNDNDFNDNDFNEHFFQPMTKDNDDYEKQLQEALNASMKDEEEKINDYEKTIVDEYNNEVQKRTELFDKLLFDLQRLLKMDKEVKAVYDIVEPIIVSYCSQYIETCEIDVETYNKMFKTLSTIRCNKETIDKLKTIIKKSN